MIRHNCTGLNQCIFVVEFNSELQSSLEAGENPFPSPFPTSKDYPQSLDSRFHLIFKANVLTFLYSPISSASLLRTFGIRIDPPGGNSE